MPHKDNLWGVIPDVPKITSPLTHLKKQATLLQEMTNGLLAAEVVRGGSPQTMILRIVAPSLGNYRAVVLGTDINVPAYPCSVIDLLGATGVKSAANEKEFLTIVQAILQSAAVKSLLTNLIGQIKGTLDES